MPRWDDESVIIERIRLEKESPYADTELELHRAVIVAVRDILHTGVYSLRDRVDSASRVIQAWELYNGE
jgi:hypothetical protein